MLAASSKDVRQLWLYWSEYAKERLAGLVGPMNVLEGKLPTVAAYRSVWPAALCTTCGFVTQDQPDDIA